MHRTFLFGKIHHARVTESRPEYSGSITIDRDLLDACGILPNERVLVADCENGSRFETYVFEGERGGGDIVINGAAALKTGLGHRIIIQAYCQLSREEQATHRPRIVICDANNGVADLLEYPAAEANDRGNGVIQVMAETAEADG
ncbi:MAG: aspartate 1-decarboxylase [Phycisphaerales bacterium]